MRKSFTHQPAHPIFHSARLIENCARFSVRQNASPHLQKHRQPDRDQFCVDFFFFFAWMFTDPLRKYWSQQRTDVWSRDFIAGHRHKSVHLKGCIYFWINRLTVAHAERQTVYSQWMWDLHAARHKSRSEVSAESGCARSCKLPVFLAT